MNIEKSLREKIKIKYETEYLDEIDTPVGHILSILVEELGRTDIDLPKLIDEINEKISIGGDGYARIRDINEDYMRYGCKKHFGISRYLNSIKFISNEKKKMIHERINNELCGITPEDLIYSELPEDKDWDYY